MRLAIALLLVLPAAQLAAQEARAPVIPNLIAPDNSGNLISVTVDQGLRSSKRLRNRGLRQARQRLHEGGNVSADELRGLAQAGDGLAAQRYIRILEASPNSVDPSDLAFFSAIAVGTGRVWTLDTMIAAMHRLDPAQEPKERVRKYIRVLYPHAWAGNTAAMQAVVDFNGEGRLFGPLSEKTRQRIIKETRDHGDGRVELSMAMSLLERIAAADRPDKSELEQAKALLTKAGASKHLAVATTAQNLMRLIESKEVKDG